VDDHGHHGVDMNRGRGHDPPESKITILENTTFVSTGTTGPFPRRLAGRWNDPGPHEVHAPAEQQVLTWRAFIGPPSSAAPWTSPAGLQTT